MHVHNYIVAIHVVVIICSYVCMYVHMVKFSNLFPVFFLEAYNWKTEMRLLELYLGN